MLASVKVAYEQVYSRNPYEKKQRQRIAEKLAESHHVECPVCYEPFYSSTIVYNCGHSVCGYCNPSLRKCPVCRTAITSRRSNKYHYSLFESEPLIVSNRNAHLLQLLTTEIDRKNSTLASLRDHCSDLEGELLDSFFKKMDFTALILWIIFKNNMRNTGRIISSIRAVNDMIYSIPFFFALLFCLILAFTYHSNSTTFAAMFIPIILIFVIYVICALFSVLVCVNNPFSISDAITWIFKCQFSTRTGVKDQPWPRPTISSSVVIFIVFKHALSFIYRSSSAAVLEERLRPTAMRDEQQRLMQSSLH